MMGLYGNLPLSLPLSSTRHYLPTERSLQIYGKHSGRVREQCKQRSSPPFCALLTTGSGTDLAYHGYARKTRPACPATRRLVFATSPLADPCS